MMVMTIKISTRVNPDLRRLTSMSEPQNIVFLKSRKKKLTLEELLSGKRKIVTLIVQFVMHLTLEWT